VPRLVVERRLVEEGPGGGIPMRNRVLGGALVALVVAGGLAGPISGAGAGRSIEMREYVVLFEDGASSTAARAAIEKLGGEIVEVNSAIGVAKVRTRNADFISDAVRESTLAGAARNRIVGYSDPALRNKTDEVESIPRSAGGAQAEAVEVVAEAEPLAELQWDMEMIHATSGESHAVQPGKRDVLVGIIDTGIDATHPDLAPNFSSTLSRNFTTDIPLWTVPATRSPTGRAATRTTLTRTATVPTRRAPSGPQSTESELPEWRRM
jgi:lantibiotic leader peptide-processing serine protease